MKVSNFFPDALQVAVVLLHLMILHSTLLIKWDFFYNFFSEMQLYPPNGSLMEFFFWMMFHKESQMLARKINLMIVFNLGDTL